MSRGTIADFCKLAGINRQQFNRYLSGAALPNPSTMARISTCLGINEEQLFINGTSSSVRQLDDGEIGGIFPRPGLKELSGNFYLASENRQILMHARHPLGVQDGYYYCYFPAKGLKNHIVRALLRIKVTGSTANFKRVTIFRDTSRTGSTLAVSKHEGTIISDTNVSYFIGREIKTETAMSMLVIENNELGRTGIRRGLGVVEGFGSHIACQLCLEKIPTEHTVRRKMLSALGLIDLNDASISPIVKVLLRNPDAKSRSMITMPSFETAMISTQ